MQPAGRADDVRPRVHEEVIRVAEHELHTGRLRLLVGHPFECAVRADGDKARCVDDAVRRVDAADTRAAARLPRLVKHLEAKKRLGLPSRKRLGRDSDHATARGWREQHRDGHECKLGSHDQYVTQQPWPWCTHRGSRHGARRPLDKPPPRE
eukprot:4487866-Prymnesium_polylepis.2